MEAPPFFCYALEKLESDDKGANITRAKEDCDMCDSESTFDFDDCDCVSDTASTTSSTSENTALVKALAQILVDTVVDWKDDGRVQRSLLATATGGNDAMDNVLPETALKPSSTVTFLRDADFVDRKPVLDQIDQKCAIPASRRLRLEDYTVGWVCALPIELAAAQAMLDEQHHDLPQNSDDANTYTLGRIGDHNVILACLPAGQTGTNSAAAVAMQMKSTFRAVRFGLMVGIGGGVPSAEADIRLGDIVVSQPGKGHGGVVQYDFGKSTPSGIQRTDFLNTPPRILHTAVSKLRANHDLGKSDLLVHISKLGGLPKFSRDQAGDDALFEAVYNHVGGSNCTSCDNAKKLQREARPVDTPEIHYGTVASGNQVMRDGAIRDQISSEFGEVLCFEMEAAGLMNSFPCLVIRGICDYADSHKNKSWQPYAAGTAAAYAKELLLAIPAADVVKIQTVDEATRGKCSQCSST